MVIKILRTTKPIKMVYDLYPPAIFDKVPLNAPPRIADEKAPTAHPTLAYICGTSKTLTM